MKRLATGLAAVAALLSLAGAPAQAEDLRVSLRAKVTTIDPHYESATQNQALARHIFEPLILQGVKQDLVPKLAESWTLVDDTTWEFKLRSGVTFHDGSPFTAADVKFSIERIPTIEDSPSSLIRYVEPITAVEVVDDHTVHIKTATAFPLLPVYLSGFVIVSKAATEGKAVADFNSGAAAIGTGPFRFAGWVPGESLKLERYDGYWGEKPRWETVSVKYVNNDATRVAELLSGTTDFIDQVPPSYVAQLESGGNATVTTIPSFRFMFIGLNQRDDAAAYFKAADGAALDKNPLQDARVRKALGMAINKQLITDRIMEGYGQKTNQPTLPEAGQSPNLPDEWYDVDGAKALLAEAGYPDGFQMTFIAPNDSYINDAQVAQAVAQMFTRIGVTVDLQVNPQTILRGKMNGGEFGVYLWAQGGTTGEPLGSLDNLVQTVDKARGKGTGNRGYYSNTEVDALVAKGLETLDDAARFDIAVQAVDMSMNDFALLPLYHMNTIDATRKDLAYQSRVDTRFYAQDLK